MKLNRDTRRMLAFFFLLGMAWLTVYWAALALFILSGAFPS